MKVRERHTVVYYSASFGGNRQKVGEQDKSETLGSNFAKIEGHKL